MSARKPIAEKRTTRKEAKARYRAKKTADGWRQITVWIPEKVATAIQGKKRLGVIVAADGQENADPVSLWLNAPGNVHPI